jgi:hypothetical protein
MGTPGGETGFISEGVTFSPWLHKPGDGWWTHPYWLATGEVEATDYNSAWRLFMKSLVQIVSRVALISSAIRNILHSQF